MKSQGILQNRRFTRFLIVLAVALAIYLSLMVFPVGGERGRIISTNVTAVIFSLLAFRVFFGVWLSINANDISRRIWGLFALGILLWAVAEVVWAYYEVILIKETPYPSPADFFWVLGYLPIYWGLTLRYKTLNVIIDQRRKFSIFTVIALLFLLIAYFVLIPIITQFDFQRLVESLLNIFYPLGDLVLLILASLILFSMGKGRFALTWRFIIIGFVVMSMADLSFSYLSWYGLYHPNGNANMVSILTDFGFNLSYLLLALGIYAYSILLDVPRAIKLSVDFGLLAGSKILIFIDSKNKIISASDNFMFLTETQNKAQYEKKLFHEIVGIDEAKIEGLTCTLREKGSISNYPLKISKAGSKDVLFTAIALFNPQNQYDGAGIVLQSELLSKETKESVLNEEQKALVESFLKKAGVSANQEEQALKAYFLEQIRLIYSLVYEFNGQYVANALLDFLEQKANEKGWKIHVDGHEISIPGQYEGQVLSASLSQLLKAGRSYGANAVSLSLIDEEMKRIDRELNPDVMRVIDRYSLRIGNQVAF